jgi:ribonuclease R
MRDIVINTETIGMNKPLLGLKHSSPADASLSLIAVDAPTTRDVDDAFALERMEDGWKATIVIADAAALVPIGSTEDAIAMQQGATIYRASETVQPMLPRRIAEDAGALRAGSKRRVLELELRISGAFEVELMGMRRAERSIAAHVPYSAVAGRARDASDPLWPMLADLIGVSQGLLNGRRARGALAYYDLTQLIYLDEEGRVQEPRSREVAIGQIVVQEMMILANAAMSRWALDRGVPLLYRNHVANVAAPPAETMARTVEACIAAGDAHAERAREQLNLVLGVAHYHPELRGHYALNLPSYLHGTSPLRRYADLIVQRQLNAALDGATLPYGQSELIEMAEALNATLAARKADRSEGFKQAVVRRAERAIDRNRFERLADHELSQVLKVAGESGDYGEALVDELVKRMLNGTLTDPVFDRLLTAPAGSLPGPVVDAWRTLLLATPQRAKHLVMHGHQTGLFSGYQPTHSGPAGGPFTVEASMRRGSAGDVLTATYTSARKQDAENGAAARLILAHLGAKAEDCVVGQLAVAQQQPEGVGNAKGRLQERCQKAQWPMPMYRGESSGPSHAPVFSATVSVSVGDRMITGSASGARTRLEAEHRAAADAIAKLPGKPPKATATVATSNPVGWLQEQCQQQGLAMPNYTFEAAPGGFLCRVQTPFMPTRTFEGRGTNQADAKRAAASSAAQALEQARVVTG